MEVLLKQILKELQDFKQDTNQRFTNLGEKISNIEEKISNIEEKITIMEPKLEESHQWIRALYEASQIHKAEVDNLDNRVSKVEGVLMGFDKSLEPLKKAL